MVRASQAPALPKTCHPAYTDDPKGPVTFAQDILGTWIRAGERLVLEELPIKWALVLPAWGRKGTVVPQACCPTWPLSVPMSPASAGRQQLLHRVERGMLGGARAPSRGAGA